MKKRDFLINLIHSLSPAEQRNFKLYSNMFVGDKAYIKLYEALEGKDDYDTTALSKKLNIPKSLLAERKNYLGHVLLLSLRNFQKETPEAEGRRQVDEAILMLGRRQFNYAFNITENALVKARKTEHFEIIPQLLKIKALCLNGLEEIFDTLPFTKEHATAIACQTELFEITLLQMQVNRIEVSRNGTDQLHKVLNNKWIVNGVNKLNSLRAQIEWFDIKLRSIHISSQPKEEMYQLCQQEIKHYQKHPLVKTIDPITYVKSFSNLAAAQFSLSNFKDALVTIRKFEQVVSDPSLQITSIKRASLKYYGSMLTAMLLRLLGRNSEALELNQKCYAQKRERPLSEQYAVTFELALTLFNSGNMDEASAITEELLKIKDNVRLDLQLSARYLKIMILANQQNYQLIPYAVKSAKAWLKHKKTEALPEVKLFLTHILAIAKAPALERKHHWADFKKLADEGKLDLLETTFSLNTWLKTK